MPNRTRSTWPYTLDEEILVIGQVLISAILENVSRTLQACTWAENVHLVPTIFGVAP